MPNIVLPISDLAYSVERPVAYDIIRQLMDITQISSKTPIRFYGDEGKAAQQKSTLNKNEVSENRWSYDERISVEVEEEYDATAFFTMAVKQPENQFIFYDAALDVYIKPAYSQTKLNFNFKYKAGDKNQAMRWVNDIRTKVAMRRDVNLHEINYSYHLDERCIFLLTELHKLRETVAPYGEDFDTYFTDRLTSKASVISNLSGKASLWAISEKQIRVQGVFDFDAVPEKPDKDSEHDTWVISFSYKVSYDKPIEVNMSYPIIVHNQLVDQRYRPSEPTFKLTDKLRTFSASAGFATRFEVETEALLITGNQGIDIPSFDQFIPRSTPSVSLRVFTGLCQIAPEDKRSLLNLSQLGDFNLDEDILNFMRTSEYSFMSSTYRSIFTLSLYRDQFLLEDGAFTVDSNLNVIATADLDLRKTYRLRLGLVAEFSYLSGAVINRFKNNPVVCEKLYKAINAALPDQGGYTDLRKNSLNQQDRLVLGLPSTATSTGRTIGMTLVQTLFVSAKDIKNYPEELNNQSYGHIN
jgi:hypothetical protein